MKALSCSAACRVATYTIYSTVAIIYSAEMFSKRHCCHCILLSKLLQGHVQTNSSKAGQSRAGAVFYVSVIPISVARQVAWRRAKQSCPDTNRNNTNIEHRASSALPCPALLPFVWKWPVATTLKQWGKTDAKKLFFDAFDSKIRRKVLFIIVEVKNNGDSAINFRHPIPSTIIKVKKKREQVQ